MKYTVMGAHLGDGGVYGAETPAGAMRRHLLDDGMNMEQFGQFEEEWKEKAVEAGPGHWIFGDYDVKEIRAEIVGPEDDVRKPGVCKRETLNERPFTYLAHHGTEFQASHCDFRDGVSCISHEDATQEQLMADVAEMAGYHAVNIWPELNGFSGYDCIRFQWSQK